MNRNRNLDVPKHLLLASMISISITVTVSISYTILSILALVYHHRQCDVGDVESVAGADYFFNLVFRAYIQKDGCNNTAVWANLTQAESVFILNIITLCASFLCCIAAFAFMTMVLTEKSHYLHLVAYVYVGVCVASQVVDITFATHFGMDYSYLTDQLNLSSPGLGMNYEQDLLRLGAFVLMVICLKGFVASFINCVLFVMIVIYVIEYQKLIQKEEHSIHKMGALNAFEQPRKADLWQPESQMFYRGPQVNPAYIEDSIMATPSRSPSRREQSTPNSRNGMENRSDMLQSQSGGSRPFSYLGLGRQAPPGGEPRRPDPRDWPPAVPAPDYSPHAPRRLKPALKPYM